MGGNGGGFSSFGGSLGGGRRGRGEDAPEEKSFPSGIEDRRAKEFNWLKGTEWYWNRWASVKFNKDGTFSAPTQSCVMSHSACKWAAYNHHGENKIFILWGDDGLHTMKVLNHNEESVQDARKVLPDNQEANYLEQVELIGWKAKDNREPSNSKEKATARFEKVFDHSAYKDSLDLYDVLGLGEKRERGEEITMSEIKKVYRKLSLQYHPDKMGSNPDPKLVSMYQDITSAYEVLSDTAKRARYDCCGMEGVKGEMQSGRDQSMTASVTLEELYSGTKRVDHIKRRIVCRMCQIDDSHPKCTSCGRCPNEMKMVQRQIGPGMVVQQQQEVKSKEKCTQETAKLHTEILRGMKDGDTITFPHMAEQTPGVLPGDVVLTLNMKKHQKFKRSGNDLHMNIGITLREALLGFTRVIKHLDDHSVTLSMDKPTGPGEVFKIKDEGKNFLYKLTGPGEVFKIKDEGMPFKDDPTQYGSLFVKAEIQMPKKLTEEQKTLVDQLFPANKKGNVGKEEL